MITEIIRVILIIIFIALSAFFSSAEIAFAKANKLRAEKAADSGDKIAKLVVKINENYTSSLSTILVGNNLVNIAASSIATVLFVDLLYPNESLGTTLASVIMTVLLLIFGETLPKIIAASIPDKMARLFSYPLYFSMIIFFPIVWLVDKIVVFLSKLWTPKQKAPDVTAEELLEIVDDIEDDGLFSEEESDMIKSAIDLSETTAEDILVPRVDMFALDADSPIELCEELYKYSRVPVYRESIDNIIGILPVKKLLRKMASGEEFKLEDLLMSPIFVHKTKTVSSIIDEFRSKRMQMAVVVDEYGGTMGILTMEDITEEIVGEIFDERDQVENDDIVEIEDNVYDVDGGTNIEDLFDELDWKPQDFETEYTTVGGWVTEVLDKFPVVGDEFEFQRIKVKVTKAASTRVEMLRVEYTPTEDEIEEEYEKLEESEEIKQ